MALITSLTLLLSTLLACAPRACATQKPADASKKERKKEAARLQPEAEAIVADARVAPPEFGADALIRLAQSAKVSDVSLKRELLEEAFRLASSVQQPFKRSSVVGNVDTRAGYMSYAFELGLDALSLRCRVVRVMLKLDARRAREVLAEIEPDLGLEVLGCEEPLVYDVGVLYETVGEVARGAFNAEELRRHEDVRLVETYVVGVRRVAQVGPAARMIVSLKLSAADLFQLVQEFASALKAVPPDARSFSASFLQDDLQQRAVRELLKECEAKGVGKDALLEAYRAYFVTQVAGVRCGNSKAFDEWVTSPKALQYFNETLTKTPVTAEELKPRSVEGPAKSYNFWRTTESRKLLMGIKQLRFNGIEERKPEEKETTEWRRELTEYLVSLSDWDGSSEPTTQDYFNEKSVLFEGLLEIATAPETREKVLSDYVSFLREPDLRRESRIGWFQYVKRLGDWARSQGQETHRALLDAFANSDVVTLRLYAKLEAFDPGKAGR